MSAPNAKHGSPTHEQLMDVVEQLAECGVCSVGITGGEPLVRKDFLDIIDALVEREIAVSTIYTNGWLVDEVLLDELEKRGVRAGFQLSFDGVGCHDFLRGVSGAEEKRSPHSGFCAIAGTSRRSRCACIGATCTRFAKA